MNLLNRAIVVALTLALLAGTTVLLLITMGALDPALLLARRPGDPLSEWLFSFAEVDKEWLLVNVAIQLAVLAAGLALLFFELRPRPRPARQLTLKDDGLGQINIQLEAIRRLVRYVASSDPDVLEIRPEVLQSADGLRVRCRATISPLASLRETSAAFQERIKESVERHLGMQVAEVSVQAQFEPLDGGAVV